MPTRTRFRFLLDRALFRGCLLIAAVAFCGAASSHAADPARWTKAIENYEQRDATTPPPAGGIVFTGSSSIAGWKTLAKDFPDLPVIGRGFGGSHISDCVFYADRIVLPYKPRTVVFYAGENDISAGVAPERVAADFSDFCERVHAALPGTKILYISMKPSPSRWHLQEKFAAANALIAERCAQDERLAYLDIVAPMLGEDGKPRPELFLGDRLHMTPEGYALWTALVDKAVR